MKRITAIVTVIPVFGSAVLSFAGAEPAAYADAITAMAAIIYFIILFIYLII